MQSNLAIDSLLSAARFLEAATAHQQASVSTSLLLDPNFSEDMELRDLISSKMRVQRPHSNASATSSEPYTISRKNSSTKQSRTAHNELEKNRRANLKDCLETLKSLVPDSTDIAKNTTLALLTRAHDHIEYLDEKLQGAEEEGNELEIERMALLQELSSLGGDISHAAVFQKSPETANRDQLEQSRPASVMSSSVASSSRASPFLFESSPSSKASPSPSPLIIDPVKEGLVSPFPICYPSQSLYPHFDLLQHASVLEVGLPFRHLIV